MRTPNAFRRTILLIAVSLSAQSARSAGIIERIPKLGNGNFNYFYCLSMIVPSVATSGPSHAVGILSPSGFYQIPMELARLDVSGYVLSKAGKKIPIPAFFESQAAKTNGLITPEHVAGLNVLAATLLEPSRTHLLERLEADYHARLKGFIALQFPGQNHDRVAQELQRLYDGREWLEIPGQ